MICKKCLHKDVCDMWIRFMSEIALYRDVDTDNIPDLSKTKDCQYLQTQSHRTTANVRFRWLKAIYTQIAKATSYIRKRCVK